MQYEDPTAPKQRKNKSQASKTAVVDSRPMSRLNADGATADNQLFVSHQDSQRPTILSDVRIKVRTHTALHAMAYEEQQLKEQKKAEEEHKEISCFTKLFLCVPVTMIWICVWLRSSCEDSRDYVIGKWFDEDNDHGICFECCRCIIIAMLTVLFFACFLIRNLITCKHYKLTFLSCEAECCN